MPGKPFQSKYGPHLSHILKWREEGKTFDQIANLLPATLKPNGRVIADLVKRQSRRKNLESDLVTIPITIPKASLHLILQTLATILSEKAPSNNSLLDHLREAVQPVQSSIAVQARANSDKALALAERLKAEQVDLTRKAAQTKPRPKLNQDRIDLPPTNSRKR